MGWLKRKLPTKKWKRVLIYLGSVLLMLVAVDVVLASWWRRIEVSPETTQITSPLNAQGMPDYLAALNALASEGVTEENNAARDLCRIAGADLPEEWRKRVLPALHLPLDPGGPLLVIFEAWSKDHPAVGGTTAASQAWGEAEERESLLFRTPWKASDYPRSAQWLASQREVLVEVRKLARKPRFYIPYTASEDVMFNIETQTPALARLRTLGNLLMTDAMRCVGEGDAAGFREDVEATLRLARLTGQGPTLIEYLVSVAIESLATKGMRVGAEQAGFLSEPQAQAMLRMLDEVPPAPDVGHTLGTAERWFSLDSVCAMASRGRLMGVDGQGRGVTLAFVPIRFNEVLRDFNRHFDTLVAAYRMRTYPEQQAALRAIEKELRARTEVGVLSMVAHPTRSISAVLLSVMMPSLVRAGEIQEMRNMNMELARVGLGMRIWRTRHGEFPETPAMLAPAILKDIPRDRFVENELIYRREGKGYVLYSVGPNGVDDGGVERDKAQGRGYDLVVRGQ